MSYNHHEVARLPEVDYGIGAGSKGEVIALDIQDTRGRYGYRLIESLRETHDIGTHHRLGEYLAQRPCQHVGTTAGTRHDRLSHRLSAQSRRYT